MRPMRRWGRRCWVWGIMAGLAGLTLGADARSAEPVEEFLRGLRDRQYFDMAILYLDQLSERASLPEETRQLIPFEKAATLQEWAKVSRSPEKQVEQLDQALAFLEQFTKQSPDHPKAADANSQRADILLGKARVEIIQSRSPVNQGNRLEYQKRARELVGQARTVFQAAYDGMEKAWKSFPTFIDADKEPERYAERQRVEVNLIRAQLDLALCRYEEAQTYDADNAEYKQQLVQAAAQFEEMHQRYRSQVGGLYARLWQGKCFEEQGDMPKAMGIYNELLGHPGTEGAISRLKDQTLQFKLICLNSKERNDHQVVIDLAEAWLKEHPAEAKTRLGLGIRWELTRAFEALGDRRDTAPNDAQKYWREARDQAQLVNRYPGEFRDMSLALIQRLEVKLGGKERLPDKFDAAFGFGRQMVTALGDAKDALTAAREAKPPPENLATLESDFKKQLADAHEMLTLATQLATRSDDAQSVAQARYMLAYVSLLQRRNYEAAILGQYVARTVDAKESTVGLDAAYLAMAAFQQSYIDAKGSASEKEPDLRFIVGAANLIIQKWPESDRANDARMSLGRIYSQLKQPVSAAEWYGKVPETDPKYPEAQLAAGQAYWTAYLSAGQLPPDKLPTAEQLQDWQKQAETFLRNGLGKLSARISTEQSGPGELIAAKFSLAQIVMSLGRDAEAIGLLLDDPHAVVKAVVVADEKQRPDKGVQGRAFATETFKLLLRGYIGVGKLDEARSTMKTLEAVAGADGGTDVTELYVSLGKLLRDELDRFRDAGELDRFNNLMTSFETFLNDLYQRQEGQSLGSLSWIGETYFALGESSANDPARADSHFEKARTALTEILKQASEKPDFATPDQVMAVKIRLAHCLRLKRDFEAAETLITEILQAREKDLKAQFEAAMIYQDWGSQGSTETAKYLMTAIRGNEQKKIWGWTNTGNRLQRLVDDGKPEYLAEFVEARLNGAESRRRFALAQTKPEVKAEELQKCEMELTATVSVMKDLDEEQFGRFNTLYRQVLLDGGKPQVDLEPATEPIVVADTKPAKKKAVKPKAATANTQLSSSSSTMPLIMLGVVTLAGLGLGAWVLMKPKKRRSVLAGAGTTEQVRLGSGPTPPTTGSSRAVGPARSSITGVASTAVKPSQKASASPAAPGSAPQPKPRPKPPAGS
jgi:cellulose synthase operon protein C